MISCFLVFKLSNCGSHNSARHRHIRPSHAIDTQSHIHGSDLHSSGGGKKCTLRGIKLPDQNGPPIYHLPSKSTDLVAKRSTKLMACCPVYKRPVIRLSVSWTSLFTGGKFFKINIISKLAFSAIWRPQPSLTEVVST